MNDLKRKSAKSFQDLVVWQKSHELVVDIYKLSSTFPKEEIYGMTFQLRRSIVSIPANIAEGFKKNGAADKRRFLNIAQGSLEESRYYLILANELNYFSDNTFIDRIEVISKMLFSYRKSIKY